MSAVFYVQVALEYIPEDRVALRNTILPVVYFLVLTSVIVHGITIPIGKGFQNARSLTLTRSVTGLTGADRISRLPAPLPFGSDALKQATAASAERDSADVASRGEGGSDRETREAAPEDRDRRSGKGRLDDHDMAHAEEEGIALSAPGIRWDLAEEGRGGTASAAAANENAAAEASSEHPLRGRRGILSRPETPIGTPRGSRGPSRRTSPERLDGSPT